VLWTTWLQASGPAGKFVPDTLRPASRWLTMGLYGEPSLEIEGRRKQVPPERCGGVLTSSATMPDACVNHPYTFAPQSSGGVPPLAWGFSSNLWVGISLDNSTGAFSGTASVIGTFMGRLAVTDASTNFDSQQVTLTVKQCP
jgi:hypothetical protein